MGIIVATLLAILSTYFYNFSFAINACIWLAWLVVSMFLGYFTNKGKEVLDFFKESKIELLKVVWPTRQETVQTTAVVMAVVTVTGFALWGIDSCMMWIIAKITQLG